MELRISAHVGDFDANRTIVRDGGVKTSLFDIECLIDGSVDIDHEVHGQAAGIVKDSKTLATGTANIIMKHELINAFLEFCKRPAAATDSFELRIIEIGGGADAVSCRRLELRRRLLP